MSDLRINWGKISTFISIISALATLATTLPFLLSFYFGNDWLARTIDQKKLASNAQGFIYYKPLLNGKLEDNTAYYLLKKDNDQINKTLICKQNPTKTSIIANGKDKDSLVDEPNLIDTFCNLHTGDILSTAQDSYMKENPEKKSRIKFIVRQNMCVQVMEEPKKEQLVNDIDANSRQGGWIKVAVLPCPTDLK